jgi:hypothetical protein
MPPSEPRICHDAHCRAFAGGQAQPERRRRWWLPISGPLIAGTLIAVTNWRRGFLRLWLVASVIWVAVNAFAFRLPESLIEVTPWLRPMRLSDLASSEATPVGTPTPGTAASSQPKGPHTIGDLPPGFVRNKPASGEATAGLPPGFVLKNPATPVEPPTQSEGRWMPPASDPIVSPAAQPEGPWTKYQAAAVKAREQRREVSIANLRGFVFFGIGPPIAVLFLGIATMWVLRGFRPINPR